MIPGPKNRITLEVADVSQKQIAVHKATWLRRLEQGWNNHGWLSCSTKRWHHEMWTYCSERGRRSDPRVWCVNIYLLKWMFLDKNKPILSHGTYKLGPVELNTIVICSQELKKGTFPAALSFLPFFIYSHLLPRHGRVFIQTVANKLGAVKKSLPDQNWFIFHKGTLRDFRAVVSEVAVSRPALQAEIPTYQFSQCGINKVH